MMPSPTKRVPDWLLERLAAGELPETQARTLHEQILATGDEARLAALATSNAQILAAYPPDRVAAEVRLRAGRVGASRRLPLWGLSFATVGAAAILLILVRTPGDTGKGKVSSGLDEQETITLKGLQPSLGLYRKTAAGVERLTPASRLHPGDVVQVRYIAAGRRYGVVVSTDARRAVTLHLPESSGQAVALEKDGERALAHAYELDNSPGFERFVFVAADVPFNTDLVAGSLRQGLALPPGFSLWSMTLQKEKP
jgi:hypothetical protein